MLEIQLSDVLISEKPAKVEVKSLNKFIYLKELTGEDTRTAKGESADDLTYKMIFKSWVKEDGSPVFESLEQAKKIKLSALKTISDEIIKLNALSNDAIEEIEKN